MDASAPIAVQIADRQRNLTLDHKRLKRAVCMILKQEAVPHARVSLAVVDDETICELNRKYLGRDEATDVLSFLLEQSEDYLEGEVIVSAETAQLAAEWYGWPVEDELLLYAIHGTLHLVGYDDATPEQQAVMREWERLYLACFGAEGLPCETSAADLPRREPPPQGSVSGGKNVP